MPGPWDKYAAKTAPSAQDGPWSKYGGTQAAPDQVLPDITVHPGDTNDVVSSMSGFQRGMAGTGASIMSQIRGLGQAGLELANQALAPSRVVTQVEGRQNIPSDYVQKKLVESKQAETEARQINAPLLATPEGFVGNLAGYAIPLAAGGAGLRGTLAARAFLPETIGGMTAQGAAMGATQPLATGEGGMDRLKNAAIGGAAGFAGAAAPRVVGAALRGTKAALEPFTKAGQEAIAARALQEGAINPASLTQSAPSAIPGVSRTLAEESLDSGIAQMQRQFPTELADQQVANNAARVEAIRSGFGGADQAAQDAAKAQARATALPLLRAAQNSPNQVKTEPVIALADKMINGAKGNPATINILSGVRDQLVESDNPVRNITQLYNTRKYIDDLLKGRAGGDTNAAKAATAELTRLKNMLDYQIGKAAPEFRQYLNAYRKGMIPANQAAIGERLLDTATATPVPGGERNLTPAAFSRATNDLDTLAQKATGFKKAKASTILTPDQEQVIFSVRDDLARLNAANTLGRGLGSPTAQNLATQNILSQATKGLGVGSGVVKSMPVRTVSSIMEKAYAAFDVPKRIQGTISQALANPAYARKIISQLPRADRPLAEQIVSRVTGPGGTVVTEGRKK